MRLKPISIIVFPLVVLLSLIALKYFPIPFLWIFFLWSFTGLLWTFSFHRPSLRLGAINLFAIMLIFFGLESYYYYEHSNENDKQRLENVYSFITGHPILGSANRANSQYIARKFYDNHLVYEASFTINSEGLRITTSEEIEAQPTNKSIIFFVCSYTWGEGVNDDESLPYITNTFTGGKFAVYNFGVSGHGPQHMLAAIEQGLVDSIVKEPPRVVIYQAIVDHVYRAAGMRDFGKKGPRYLLSSSGEVIYAGNFINCNPIHDNCFIHKVKRQLTKSYLFRRLVLNRITNTDIEIFIKVVEKSRRLLQEKYPELEFHVLFWHKTQDKISNAMLRALQGGNFNIHLIQQIISDYNEHRDRYHILHDGHPNALAYRKVARYVAGTLIAPDELGHTSEPLRYPQFQNP